ncbi:MAG: ribonuclease HI family protein [Deltaproteobacteria bacterium]|jgi:ribonuclease HI|nr:ribonuclease HI family protein [Deltaproteobacteria bacterium]
MSLAPVSGRHALYADGSSLGNPGPGGAGALLLDPSGREVFRLGVFLGDVTSSQAEYQGLILGVRRAFAAGARVLDVHMDSETVVCQIQGAYKVKATDVKNLHALALEELSRLEGWTIAYVSRKSNAVADLMAGRASSLGKAGVLRPGGEFTGADCPCGGLAQSGPQDGNSCAAAGGPLQAPEAEKAQTAKGGPLQAPEAGKAQAAKGGKLKAAKGGKAQAGAGAKPQAAKEGKARAAAGAKPQAAKEGKAQAAAGAKAQAAAGAKAQAAAGAKPLAPEGGKPVAAKGGKAKSAEGARLREAKVTEGRALPSGGEPLTLPREPRGLAGGPRGPGEGAQGGPLPGRPCRPPARAGGLAAHPSAGPTAPGLDPAPARHLLFADGASLGNPGPGGAGAVLLDPSGRPVFRLGVFLGQVTNNQAEYQGLSLGAARAFEAGVRSLDVRMDSELVVRQIQGVYKVKAAHLKGLFAEAAEALSRFEGWSISHVRRNFNAEADRMAGKAALLGKKGSLRPGGEILEPCLPGVLSRAELALEELGPEAVSPEEPFSGAPAPEGLFPAEDSSGAGLRGDGLPEGDFLSEGFPGGDFPEEGHPGGDFPEGGFPGDDFTEEGLPDDDFLARDFRK